MRHATAISLIITLLSLLAPLSIITDADAAIITGGPKNNRYAFNADVGLGGDKTWFDANTAAPTATAQPGFGPGHLVTITSLAESQFIRTGLGVDLVGRYIGLFQPVGNVIEPGTPAQPNCGGWQWVTGEAFCVGTTPTFENWQQPPNGTEPNNAGAGENQVQLTGTFDAQGQEWNDTNGATPRQFVVEFERLAAVPEPGTTALLGISLAVFGITRLRNKA
jgi:hypothetical protein